MATISRTSVEEEILWREAVWAEMQNHPEWPDLPARFLNELRVYRGQAGIWHDVKTTSRLATHGIAVSILHTGRHYDDDLYDDGIIYHYPTTNRSGSTDANQVEAVKEAGRAQIPVFVIVDHRDRKRVRRAYVRDFDESSRIFSLRYESVFDTELNIEIDHDGKEKPFEIVVKRNLSDQQVARLERSSCFKFDAIKRFSGHCAVSGISVVEMLDGAHVIPVKDGGSDDPRNALLLSASHHRAFDKHLWVIHPKTFEIETKPMGPTLSQMKFARDNIRHLSESSRPHPAALETRYELFRKALERAS